MMWCPSCAAQTPPVVWSIVAAFLAVPFAVAAAVIWAIHYAGRRALGQPASEGSLSNHEP
jgi:hypothetical protein